MIERNPRSIGQKRKDPGMKMNAKETKTMVISRSNSSPKNHIAIAGKAMKQVDTLIYTIQVRRWENL